MTELLTTNPYSIAIAVALAIGIDLFRRIYLLIAGRARRFWFGADAPLGVAPTGWVAELCSYFLYPVVAVVAFACSVLIIVVTATLMGFDPSVKLGSLAHGGLLLWTLAFAFLWVQVWYVMSLPGFWRRVRYILLLVAVPMLLQSVTWLALDGVFRLGLADSEDLKLASRLSRLICIGAFPFFMPIVHARLLAPVFTAITESTARRWQLAVTALGCVVLVAVAIGAAWGVGEVGRTTLFAHTEVPAPKGTVPVAIGAPHACMSDYPALSRRIGEEGVTTLAFRITTLGTVRDVTVVRSSGSPRLDLAAVSCVTHWTYIPAAVNGQKVEAPWKVQVVWKMH